MFIRSPVNSIIPTWSRDISMDVRKQTFGCMVNSWEGHASTRLSVLSITKCQLVTITPIPCPSSFISNNFLPHSATNSFRQCVPISGIFILRLHNRDAGMAYLSKQLFVKFACVVVASLVTVAGVLMSMDLLRQMADKEIGSSRSRSSTRLQFLYRMEQDEGCGDCSYNRHSGSYMEGCCRKITPRKWGPLSPPSFQFFDGNFDIKLRMTPTAERNHPFLRRTPGIDYSQQSNSTNYVYLFPDPISAPLQAPEPSVALPPLFWDDYQQPYIAPWEHNTPQITTYPPLTDYSYEEGEPPIA